MTFNLVNINFRRKDSFCFLSSLKLSAKLLFVLADPYYKIIAIFTVAVFFRQQSHIRIWDAETLITLAVLSLQDYNLSISCLGFSQEVCWLRQSLHLIIMHDNKYSYEGLGASCTSEFLA